MESCSRDACAMPEKRNLGLTTALNCNKQVERSMRAVAGLNKENSLSCTWRPYSFCLACAFFPGH